jgi:hypothetical protein
MCARRILSYNINLGLLGILVYLLEIVVLAVIGFVQ